MYWIANGWRSCFVTGWSAAVSFRRAIIRDIRDLTRRRRQLIGVTTTEKNRIQKILEDANIKLGQSSPMSLERPAAPCFEYSLIEAPTWNPLLNWLDAAFVKSSRKFGRADFWQA